MLVNREKKQINCNEFEYFIEIKIHFAVDSTAEEFNVFYRSFKKTCLSFEIGSAFTCSELKAQKKNAKKLFQSIACIKWCVI